MRRVIFDRDHDDYRRAIRESLERIVVPHRADWERAGIVPRTLFTDLGELGVFGFGVPEEYGGAGVTDFRFNMILMEEAHRLGVADALAGSALQSDICLSYFSSGSDEQRARWLPGIVSGETITAVAMTEPGAGSDLSGIATKAVRDGGHYVIDGAKTFISNGINADLVIVVVRTGEHPHRGLSLLVVDRDTAGFERGRNLDKVGLHAQDTAELFFSAARVPAGNLLGAEGSGFAQLTANLTQERLSVAAGAVAGAATALDWTVEHVRNRAAFGAPIGALQHTRFRMAEMATEIDVARQYIDRCVVEHNAGRLDSVDAAKAKWWTTELQWRVLDTCVQLHGGLGYMTEHRITRAWADARVQRIYAGTTEIMKDLIGRSMKLG
ncbi:acyl-CoA dehydrogenase family protein [Nakamurella sp.]|uniref:acyl-CoA dehydrogenase family protein n=1 Tax=Nakamurella sp. TaxID=1869182 RepID=UPI0037845C3E